MSAGSLFTLIAGLLGGAGVLLGAFGAHGLKARLGSAGLDTWHTAVTYHLIHALALLAIGIWLRTLSAPVPAALPAAMPAALLVAGWSFVAGVLLFSGSLYLLALGGPRLLGPVTPLGGVMFLVGWLAVVWAALAITPQR